MKPIQLKKLLHVTLAQIIKGILDSSISRDDTGADGRCGRRMSCCSCKQLVVLKINGGGVVHLTHYSRNSWERGRRFGRAHGCHRQHLCILRCQILPLPCCNGQKMGTSTRVMLSIITTSSQHR